MAAKTKYRDVQCGVCGRTFVTKEPRKLFCEPCGIARRATKVKTTMRLREEARNPALAAIADATADRATTLPAAFHTTLDYEWSTTFAIPFTLNTSKNRRWSNNGGGVTYLTRSVREFERGLIGRIRLAVKDISIKQAKVWISIFVQKPNHRSDAVNTVDTICDAVKKAIEVDDRWFSIDRVDWEIKKKDPQIYIRIAQEAREDMLVCSYCGEICTLDRFNKNKHGPLGRSRVCRQCDAIHRKEAKRLRKETQS